MKHFYVFSQLLSHKNWKLSRVWIFWLILCQKSTEIQGKFLFHKKQYYKFLIEILKEIIGGVNPPSWGDFTTEFWKNTLKNTLNLNNLSAPPEIILLET